MRLHRLRMEAFGPFAGVQDVQFDELSDLFLLHGPTGAGKSSVLDAVCFALYGQVPGARGSVRPRLRSDHAADGVPPRVVLEVTLGGRRLEITRCPEWVRPKKRGTGTTREPASTDVRELVDGEWRVLVARRSDEAGLLLRDLLGMGLDQFTKVVLLPQGEFAAFLQAGAEQRAEVLGRLFDIDRYTATETWLRGERVRLAQAVAEADAHRDRLLARAQEAAASISGAALTSDAELALADPPGLAVVEALAVAAATAADQAQAALRTAQAEADEAARRLADGTEQARRVERRSRLAAQLAALQADAGAHAANLDRLAAARRASQLHLLLHRLDDTARQLEDAGRTTQRVGREAQHVLGWQQARPPAGWDVDDALEQRRADLARLDPARELERELQVGRADLAAAQAVRADSAAAVERLRAEAAAAGLVQDEAQRRVRSHELLAAGAPELKSAVRLAEQVLASAVELECCTTELDDTTQQHRVAQDAELAARAHWLDVRERRIAGMAAELAAGLEPGAPCAVCGSSDHPRPASVGERQVSARAEREAQRAQEAAAEALRTLDARRAQLSARHAELMAGSGGLAVVDAETKVAEHSTALGRALAAADAVIVEQRTLEQAAEARSTALAQQQVAALDEAAAAARIDEIGPRVAAQQASMLQVLGTDPDVASRELRLRQGLDAIRAIRAAAGHEVALKATHHALLADVGTALSGLGFPDLPAARAALLDDAQLAELSDAVDQHDRSLADLTARLGDPDLQVPEVAAPDLVALQTDLQQGAAALRRSADQQALATQAARSLTRLAEQVRAHEELHHDLHRWAAHVDELSRCLDGTGGGNLRRMRLTAFVLAARLEEVAAAASERLVAMSDGRYCLTHTDELARSGARSGLGLQVLDSWTGVARDTATLSGGETFLASLALALGLADVVQAEAGGTSIETLFVDEGFGTLDEDTLDEVMGVLDGLRDGGRTVGLVSHVRELRNRIPSQLEVRRTRSGSSIEQVSGRAG